MGVAAPVPSPAPPRPSLRTGSQGLLPKWEALDNRHSPACWGPSGDFLVSCLEGAGVLLDFCFSDVGKAELFERVHLL